MTNVMLISVLLATSLVGKVRGQVIPDNTLGSENSVVTPIDAKLGETFKGICENRNDKKVARLPL